MKNKIPECKFIEPEVGFSIEKHGDGYALYFGRGDHSHGLNLCSLTDFDAHGEHTREMIVAGLNILGLKPESLKRFGGDKNGV